MSPVSEALRLSLSPMTLVETPSNARSTRKPRITPSSLAQTSATSATGEWVIQYLPPFST